MTETKFRFGPATFHFLQTDGPRGFLLRYALAYALVSVGVQAASLWLQGPVYEIYFRACVENGCDFTPYTDELNSAGVQANLSALMLLPLTLGIWVVFEAASQRRYIRGEGFRLALGGDEGRLAIVGLIWAALLIVGYFALVIGALIPGLILGLALGAAAGVIAGALALLAGAGVALWLFARLSPASALTIRDREIRFFEAWPLSRGQGGGLALSYLALFLAFLVMMILAYGALLIMGIALLPPSLIDRGGDADAISDAVRQPGFWMPLTLAFLPAAGLLSLFAHALGGPAAWVVRARTLSHGTALSETFS